MSTRTITEEKSHLEPHLVVRLQLRKYVVGDVLHVFREIPNSDSRLVFYCHAGIVTEVGDDGDAMEVLDFDPRENNENLALHLVLNGTTSQPRSLRGRTEIEAVFDPLMTIVRYPGPEETAEREKILERVEEARNKNRLYQLTGSNCQHFATEMRYGPEAMHSEDMSRVESALRFGMEIANNASRRFLDWSSPALRRTPFNRNHFWGRVANGGFIFFVSLCIVAALIVIALIAFGFGTAASYLGSINSDFDKRKPKKEE